MSGLCLILFLKNPVPGRVKTRLGRVIGMDVAAQLYRAFVSDILGEAARSGVYLWLCVDGEAGALPKAWGATAHGVTTQVGKDLGRRMGNAFEDAFKAGFDRVGLAGTDIPEWTAEHFKAAGEALETSNAVIVPTGDGGYGMIGFQTGALPQGFFDAMPWSTPDVFSETMARFERAGVNVIQPFCIEDIDTISDLAALHQRLEGGHCKGESVALLAEVNKTHALSKLSVVIPVFDEPEIVAQVTHVRERFPLAEIVVVDGEASGSTLARLAQGLSGMENLCMIHSARGRGIQLETGRKAASGGVILMLHADTRLPEDAEQEIRRALYQGYSFGAFGLHIEDSDPRFRTIEKGANWRSKRFGLPYGDQAIFVTSDLLHEAGGVPPLPLMEDVALCQTLRKRGVKPHILSSSVLTSARRWIKKGIWRASISNLAFLFLYLLGVSPAWLTRRY